MQASPVSPLPPGALALETGPVLPASRRAMRAAGVAAAWVVAALPTATGWQKCTIATLFHQPCPGCGMTRAVRLMVAGRVAESLRMHPLAVPVALVGLLFVASTVWTTYERGSPVRAYEERSVRIAIALLAVVYAATFALWVARWFGLAGGPVPVG